MKSAEDIIDDAFELFRKNQQRIVDLMPCSVTIHLPPAEGTGDGLCLEIKARLKPR